MAKSACLQRSTKFKECGWFQLHVQLVSTNTDWVQQRHFGLLVLAAVALGEATLLISSTMLFVFLPIDLLLLLKQST
jgi:hypothetical protein